MEIRKIDWQQAIPLRHKVLWPTKPAEFCHVDGDASAYHIGAFVDDQLVSVASMYPDGSCVRLRKFATDQAYQGRGIGSAVLTQLLLEAKQRQFSVFWCDARESATQFYARFGMKIEGDKFYKSSEAYFKMSVNLAE